MRLTVKFIRSLFSAAAVVALIGCGSATAGVSGPTPTPATQSPTPAASPSPDVAGASAAAMTIIVPLPGTSGVWASCSQLASDFASCPFAPALIARLNYVSSTGYFGDAPPSGVCAEDYITGDQNGLFAAPLLLSATPPGDGSVVVVIKRGLQLPNFTVTMNLANAVWLASDLASGSGSSASIFSAKPNC
jgi:hypothetical protein